jgi:hypothetical protein
MSERQVGTTDPPATHRRTARSPAGAFPRRVRQAVGRHRLEPGHPGQSRPDPGHPDRASRTRASQTRAVRTYTRGLPSHRGLRPRGHRRGPILGPRRAATPLMDSPESSDQPARAPGRPGPPLWISGNSGPMNPDTPGNKGPTSVVGSSMACAGLIRRGLRWQPAVEQVGPEVRGGGACSSGPTWFREPPVPKPARQGLRPARGWLRAGPWWWRLPWSRGGLLRRGLLAGWEPSCR